jgi:ligand-binding sensor domain-containing protein
LNNLWVATNGSGIAKYDGNVWTVYNKSNSELTDDYTFWITVDKYDNKWIGTLKGGLSIFNENGVHFK